MKGAAPYRLLDSGRLRLPLTVIDEEKRKTLKSCLEALVETL